LWYKGTDNLYILKILCENGLVSYIEDTKGTDMGYPNQPPSRKVENGVSSIVATSTYTIGGYQQPHNIVVKNSGTEVLVTVNLSSGENFIHLGWNASIDSAGIAAYIVYKNSRQATTTTSTSLDINGLDCDSMYTLFRQGQKPVFQ
jgi:hypothetical protein